MKKPFPLLVILLLAYIWSGCNHPETRLQANTWMMYERIQTDLATADEVKSKFSKADRALILQFEEDLLKRTENEVTMEGKWALLDPTHLNMMGEEYEIVRLGSMGLILATERNGYRQQLQFAPEDCPCWKN